MTGNEIREVNMAILQCRKEIRCWQVQVSYLGDPVQYANRKEPIRYRRNIMLYVMASTATLAIEAALDVYEPDHEARVWQVIDKGSESTLVVIHEDALDQGEDEGE